MASPAKSGPNSNPELEGHEGANVDKIRDILFGSQMRDYDKRFGRLEERLIKDAESLRDEMKKRFETLENFVQKELESLGQRLKTEKAERAEAVKEIGVQMRDTSKAFDKRLGSLDDQLTGDTSRPVAAHATRPSSSWPRRLASIEVASPAMPTTTAATSQYACASGPAWVRRSTTPLRDWLSR